MSGDVHVRFCESGEVRLLPATLLVILARCVGGYLQSYVADTVERWLGLTINRDKTRVTRLTRPKASLDFLGYTYRYERDLYGRGHRYLYAGPSKKALAHERETLRKLTSPKVCFVPIPTLIRQLNKHLRSWKASFRWGHTRRACRAINSYVRERLWLHLQRRSQRPFSPPKGVSAHTLFQRWGLVYL